MADVDDRPARWAPRGEQRQPVRIHLVVPPLGPGRAVERLLHVDGKEDSAIEIDFHEIALLLAEAARSQKEWIVP